MKAVSVVFAVINHGITLPKPPASVLMVGSSITSRLRYWYSGLTDWVLPSVLMVGLLNRV